MRGPSSPRSPPRSWRCPCERVTVAAPDTSITPYDQTTSSSRSTVMMGRAVQEASEDVRGQLVRIAAGLLGGARADQIDLDDGHAAARGRRVAYSELLRERFGMSGGELIGRGVVAPGRSRAPLGGSTPFWEMAVGAAEVGVDEETGAVIVDEYVSVADVGRRINPQQCEGQDEGAVMQGLGHTLLEEMVYGEGQLLNANLVDYRVPRAHDVPAQLSLSLRRERRRRRAVRREGRGRGQPHPGESRRRQCAGPVDRRAVSRAAADPGARVARASERRRVRRRSAPSPLWEEGRVRAGSSTARGHPHPGPLPGRERERSASLRLRSPGLAPSLTLGLARRPGPGARPRGSDPRGQAAVGGARSVRWVGVATVWVPLRMRLDGWRAGSRRG